MSDLAPHELRVLIAVDRERGFTAAAASLGTTQSAVSHAVRTCERKLGVVLFDRGRHGARPTAAAHLLMTPGGFGFVPKNCPHSYRMERRHSQVVGVAAGPGGTFERFYENLGVPTEQLGLPREPVIPEPGKFATVPQQYDVRFLPGHQ
ncbi:LysR family transcriptional regulator [Streptomyces sp. NPDC017529]|uniref:LysR family transcriptional regulator n=1 Tax=Streptomyces sp. NPDC017529 TaxID=3365000 RepID=UPI003792F743